MPEPLKNSFGRDIPTWIADRVKAAHPVFDADTFLCEVSDGYDDLELTPRGWRIAHCLHRHLPAEYPEAVEILLASLGPEITDTKLTGMESFRYLPHVLFVAEYGINHFELSMQAQYALTQCFTAEFSIRAFIKKYPKQTLARLRQWAGDDNVHVRRLVSEGTRPRLPWASRLALFQYDPGPVLELLELLKDDPELYVRRSVANNLNDIGKDNPDRLFATAARWSEGASDERQWLIRHALRSAVKRGETGALAVLGFSAQPKVEIRQIEINPHRVCIGENVRLAFDLVSSSAKPQRLQVDFQIHYVKANGATRAKVFKLRSLDFAPGQTVRLQKQVSCREMSTRRHYPGKHRIDLLINGQIFSLGAFDLVPAKQ
ncbi:MAG: DNA alkylation repair protein [Motiliproteus sp.]